MAHRILLTLALAAVLASLSERLLAQAPETVFFGAETDDVHSRLSQACLNRGMAIVASGAESLVCGQRLSGEESFLQGLAERIPEGRVDQHMLRFELRALGDDVRVQVTGWIELLDAGGGAAREDLTSFDYRADLQAMLRMLAAEHGAARIAALPQGPWERYYDEEGEWRLDAHRRAVARCDEGLAALDPDVLEERLAASGVQPFSIDLRGRCEELYEAVYLWGLARGVERPEVDDYVRFARERSGR